MMKLVLALAMVVVVAATNNINAKSHVAEKHAEVKKEVKVKVEAKKLRHGDDDHAHERITTIPTTSYPYSTTPVTSSAPLRTTTTGPDPPINLESRPSDCADYLMRGFTRSGVYVIYPFTCTCTQGIEVWCDMETDGGGWTVFLSRQNQTHQIDFNRTWDEYKDGFGDPYTEYYLGNQMLHAMTTSRSYTVRMDFELVTGGSIYATYDSLKMADEEDRYKMTLTGDSKGTTSAEYCFRYWSGRYFTTIDRDYDSYSGNCAIKQGGGWWYYNCNFFNPTNNFFGNSLTLKCYSSTLVVTKLHIKVRPTICDASYKMIHLNEIGCNCHIPQ